MMSKLDLDLANTLRRGFSSHQGFQRNSIPFIWASAQLFNEPLPAAERP
jgi:hypothetical protein